MAQQPKESLQQIAYETIHEWIVSGKLDQGSVTSEVFLSEELDMSRTPVRSALQRLEWEGYVRIVPKHGVLILDHSARKVGDLIDILCSQLLFAVHAAYAGRSSELAAWLEECESSVKRFAQIQDESERSERLSAFEKDAFQALIRLIRNNEMEQQFVHTVSRLSWNKNKRRWLPPFLQDTTLRFESLLDGMKTPDEGLFHSLLRYGEQLKRTWG
ncbi:GntR family transcriptional regulator [Paenibacillus sp. MBLB4367]|uniref:GntR family transcriptional regulator n=1 Tax=Paenibacillus sp. MBLB4367 TaxID=3384767 RepID=UPI0039081067